MEKRSIVRLSWADIREVVRALNTDLADLIDAASPDDSFCLYKIDYRFGDDIVKNGLFQVPAQDGRLVPINHFSVDSVVQSDLIYNFSANPVGLVLQGCNDLFIRFGAKRIIPFALVPKGKVFGLWKILDPKISHCPSVFCWDLTSGARFIFMLPKISEKGSHKRLTKHFKIHSEPVSDIYDHWRLFRDIAQASESNWQTSMLFFSVKWFEHLNDPAWEPLKSYFHQVAWNGSQFWRNLLIWQMTFSRIQIARDLRPPPYIEETVRHLFALAVGALPGFQPATDDGLAPVQMLQECFSEIYGLKHPPIIMQPSYISCDNPIYYSLQYPTSIELPLKSCVYATNVTNLYHAGLLIQKYLDAIQTLPLNIETTPLYHLPSCTQFDLFHSNASDYQIIQPSQLLPQQDKRMMLAHDQSNGNHFPYNSKFLNGCVRITRTKPMPQ